MARMLQALKNLEARRPASAGLLAHLADRPAPPPEAPSPAVAALDSAEVALAVRPARREEPPVLLQSPRISDHAPSRDRRGTARNPAALERAVRRTLADPGRAKPLAELSHRLARDLEQTGSKSVLWIGVGASIGGPETLLPTAALLAAELPAGALVIDADFIRRPLSEGLEYGQEPGLAELLQSLDAPSSRCRPTAFDKLSFLPAGLSRHADPASVGPRLEELLERLTREFSVVLIDGGRSGEAAASSLARLADATYFVVQLGAVEACEAQAVLRDFRAAGARVLGCVAT